MHFRAIAFAATAICFSILPAAAQENVYLRPFFSFDGPGPAPMIDLIIKEQRRGRELVSATADFCIPAGGKVERVVLDLKPDGDRLEGSGVSQGSRTRVALKLIRALKEDRTSYAGTFFSGLKEYAVSTDNANLTSEESFRQETPNGPELLEEPDNFLLASPQTLAVRIKFGTLPEWIKLLRGHNFTVDLQPADMELRVCSELRAGYQTFRVSFPPEQLQAAMAKLKAMPMVLAVGYAGSDFYRATIRVPGKDWTVKGKPNRDLLKTRLERAATKAFGATLVTSEWDKTTGELVLQLKRPSLKFRELGFTDVIPVRFLVSPERPKESENLLIWLADTTGQLVDENPGPRVGISRLYFYAGPPEGLPLELDEAGIAIARELKGQIWNMEKSVWE